jgi:hypothetical protein
MKIRSAPAGWEIQDSELVEEAFDPYSVQGFGHMQENGVSQSPLVKVSIDSFNEAGQLQRRAVFGSEPELLVTQQTALVYFFEDPSE